MRLRGNLFLLGAAFIWGTTFVAQQSGMDSLGPFSYAAARYALGVLAMLVIWYAYRGSREQTRRAGTYRSGWKAGVGAGCILFVASSMQQVAMQYTTAGKAAFITCLYIIFVPLAAVLLKKKIRPENWAGAALAITGLYFLCVKEELTLGYGDMLVLISSFFWTAHILYIDRFASMVDAIELSVMQLFISFVGSTVCALMLEDITWAGLCAEAFPIFYGGVMSSGIAFTLQIVGQKYAEPSYAAIIMSLESVFGAASSWAILGEVMRPVEIMGCMLMVAGMIVTQVGGLLHQRKSEV